jgi:hypothetical protein
VVDGNDTITVESPDDAVFGKLYDRRYDEMRELLDQYACTTADSGAAQSPLSASDCDTLRNLWDNGKDKLVKALQATIDPKTSAGAQTFQSHQQQLEAYGTQLAGMTVVGPDPANRIGEQLAAVDILLHILVDKVLPSIPPQGWMEDDDTWAN